MRLLSRLRYDLNEDGEDSHDMVNHALFSVQGEVGEHDCGGGLSL